MECSKKISVEQYFYKIVFVATWSLIVFQYSEPLLEDFKATRNLKFKQTLFYTIYIYIYGMWNSTNLKTLKN